MAHVSKKNHLCEGLCFGKEIFPNRLRLKTLFPAWHCHLQDPQSLQGAKGPKKYSEACISQTCLLTLTRCPSLGTDAQARTWRQQAKCSAGVLESGAWGICIVATFYSDKRENTTAPHQGCSYGWKRPQDA